MQISIFIFVDERFCKKCFFFGGEVIKGCKRVVFKFELKKNCFLIQNCTHMYTLGWNWS